MDQSQSQSQAHKAHRAPKEKKNHTGRNEKAFISSSGAKANVLARRNADKAQTQLHVPMADRTFNGTAGQGGKNVDVDIPPVIVAVVGPSGVGKTTLIRSMVRRYTKNTMAQITGPVTVVSGKNRRLTFMECPNDLGSIMDVTKVADLVLLLVDGSVGFEMETFEALAAMQAHGMPKVMSVLTHLDLIRTPAQMRAQKKKLKHRFWTEVYDGAKMFYLSGVKNGRYPDREILNLSRFISVAKFRPLTFRNTHPYLLVDRFEDLTPSEQIHADPKKDRHVAFFGYLRGVHLRPPTAQHHVRFHIPGSGVDAVEAESIVDLKDPCPLPTKESEKRRKMSERNRTAYAPMSGAALSGGGVSWDGERLWIATTGDFSGPAGSDHHGVQMVRDLQEAPTLGNGLAQADFQLIDGGAPIDNQRLTRRVPRVLENGDRSDDDGAGSIQYAESDSDMELPDPELQPGSDVDDVDVDDVDADGIDADGALHDETDASADGTDMSDDDAQDDSASDSDAGGSVSEYSDATSETSIDGIASTSAKVKQALRASSTPRAPRRDWTKLVYESDARPDEVVYGQQQNGTASEDASGLFQRVTPTAAQEETFRPALSSQDDAWTEDVLDSLRRFFITGDDRGSEEEEDASEQDSESDASEDDEESRLAAIARRKEQLKEKFDETYDNGDADVDDDADFYTTKKKELADLAAATRREFGDDDAQTRAFVLGYGPGTYVRVEVAHCPCEMVTNFDPRTPMILGGLLPQEEAFGMVQMRIKRHRWFPKVLKTNDPLMLSVGWRRFQTLPVYSLYDGTRNRMLKYTPEHMHCLATFYGPISSPTTGVSAFQRLSNDTSHFRICGMGVVTDIDGTSEIVKRLKLTGTPMKVYKNTAFIKDMFTSSLEVAKFEGAHIRTVSGIRGQVKRPLAQPNGAFRATFEDKILMSDIVFLKAWYQVKPRSYYNPIASLLLPDKSSWTGMRLTGQVRRDQGIATPIDINSTYKPIERQARRFNTLKIPRKLQAALPYATKPKIQAPQRSKSYLAQRKVPDDPAAKRSIALIQQMQAVSRVKDAKRADSKRHQAENRNKRLAKEEARRADKFKQDKKEYFADKGRSEKRKAEGAQNRYAKKARSD